MRAAVATVRLSPDGKKLVSNAGDPNSQMSVDELARSVRTRLTADADTDHGNPVWSPDGSSIIYGARAGSGKGKSGIYRMASDGAGRGKLRCVAVELVTRREVSPLLDRGSHTSVCRDSHPAAVWRSQASDPPEGGGFRL